MLSRFYNLPAISALLPQPVYPQEVIDNAITEIKQLGKRQLNGDDSLKDILRILALMKKFSDSVHTQRVCCHALSNLAMQVVAARWIIQKGGFKLIQKAVQRFIEDHKLCWLASSAVWNLARPPANRNVVGREGAKMMLEILFKHRNREKVTNTAIGALSNLSLCDELKDFISQRANLDLVLGVLGQHIATKSVPVMTSGAGLVANLAVSDLHASTLVERNCLPILLQLLTWDVTTDDDTLHRNTCAALNNMVTANEFLEHLLRARGVEFIFQFLERNDNELYHNLLENCLVNIDTDGESKTTSFHLAAFHGKIDVLKTLVKDYPEFMLDSLDSNQMTSLDYAITQRHLQIVEFLCRCGAKKCNQSQSVTEENDETPTDIKKAMDDGSAILDTVLDENKDAIRNALKHFPTELCDFMNEWVSVVDKLEGAGVY